MFPLTSIFSLIFAISALISINSDYLTIRKINNVTTKNNTFYNNSTYNNTINKIGYINDNILTIEQWHSLWHMFIFLTAGIICHTRLMFDKILYPNIYNRTRTSSNSL